MVRTVGSSDQPRQRARFAGQLQPRLLEVVQIEVGVTEGVYEVPDLQIADLGHQMGQQGVGGDVERHAEEDVGRALVELAGEPAPAGRRPGGSPAGGAT